MTNQEYENQAWLTNWLRLKAKQEEKDFNNLASIKEKIRTLSVDLLIKMLCHN